MIRRLEGFYVDGRRAVRILGCAGISPSFVGDLGPDADARPIARAMIGIAYDLGLRVVGEGAETQGTLDVLRAWDCDQMQRCFTGRPMPAAARLQAFAS